MLNLFLYFLCIGLSYAQILQNGQCDPNIVLQDNLNIERFSDRWYSIGATVSPLQTGDCSYIEIKPINNITSSGPSTLSVYIRSLNQNFLEEINGNATVQNGSATFSMNFASVGKVIDFNVMITDYDNYALAYSCENVGTTQRNIYIWQLGRTTAFTAEMITNLMNTLMSTNFNLTTADLAVTQHTDMACYELPDIAPGQSVILPGQCDPNLPVVQNFSAIEFQGVWHQIASYYSANSVGGCNRAEYTLRGSVVDVLNSEVISQTLYTIAGNATITSNDTSARLLVTLEVAPNVIDQRPLWILATDYSNYAVSYTCVDLANNQKQVNSWILSRTRQLTASVQADVDRVISSYIDLNNRYFVQADQSDAACFYYPDSNPDQSVVFRGQCDETIPVVSNFSVADYLGVWHTIESYPSEYQFGSCNNAQYSLGANGVVDVYNTEVINQTLSFINGIAQLASTDGSAKLNVTFPILGTNFTITTNYWVLATDYNSYALVYSCTNINNDEKRVSAWKLSRSKQLPPAAAAIFEQTMRNISVLEEQYFYSNDQNDCACFYYPEPLPGKPVVFRGQCDESISAISNFNSSLFAGTWYEVQAYPKDYQPGQCINHAYSVTQSGLSVISSSVNDQLLEVSNSSVTLNGTSGRLSITIPANGTVITIPFWILSVDYQDYALAYSCMNVGEDSRAVYSWKLSRTTQLSATANNQINNIVSDINVLDERYYENISHSDDACFYFPDFYPGEPIILNGQCDPNIQAVQNFSVADYQGRWRLIESYPSDFQTGTCNEARYTAVNGSDLIEVVNSQVVNTTLVSTTGTAVVNGSGILTVTFSGNSSMQLIVLGTDYTSYSLAYSCENISNNSRRVWSWKLSRSRQLTDAAITNINRIVDSVQVLNNRYFEVVNQTDDGCFYFPEPGPNPVIFRGQCNESIPAISNFNATAYLGLWHNIESYPSLFQDGTCNNAFYSPGSSSDVDVYNTQVVNQMLDEIWGTANLSSTDNSGKLLVSFPIAGTNQSALSNYWILDTDYVSYALVYSCVNIDNESRQVWSWKLSRSKSLTSAASNAINSVMNTIPVLDNQYFQNDDQSTEGCFYYPEPQPGVVVEFPGQCNESIQAVANFNMSAFQGIWYEIEAYPKEQKMGQCINHEYSLSSSNNMSLISTNVLNQLLGTSFSNVAFTTTQDTSGKLTVTLNTDSGVVSFPFWILSTDYEDYALAYSCVNINSDFRRIFSWKLSRSQSLSSSANTSINNTISNIEVLQNRYYERIDQSDAACFYLPNITLNEPVIFNGQCDPNISVVSNFNVTRYGGRWRIISTYYAEQQTDGSCGQAEYSLRNNLVYLVNSQVINETLFTVQGTASLATNDSSAKLEVQIGNNTSNLWILDTDYDSYAIAYNCRNLENNRRRVYSWILSRDAYLSSQAVDNISKVIDSINVLDNRYYQDVDQSDAACFYYPEPNPSQPVVFRGQCDQNISVVTDFNITEYMGQWFDTASYPSSFQGGSCNTAQYTLNGTQVDVLNSEVINETLATATAVGRFAGATNVAKLLVNFGAADSDYWVLSTDYSSYALVYSCKNIDDEHRQVGSWKLSRSRQLTTSAAAAINNTIATIPVLDNQYYIIRDHSATGCFYYPEPQPGAPVVFPGQCDTNIQPMQNFNISAFQGVWHEIQKYPTSRQSGECLNQEYTLSSTNSLNVITRNVQNQILVQNNGSASFNATNGQLTLTIQNGNESITLPFWVLNSDYNDYALVYGCENINSEERRVYSWKLSRTKELSNAANTVINNRINDIQVLDNRYYDNVDQSDAACFYLPDLGPGEDVIFPGQCDQNINVVRNFNATRYVGRWRLIETYHTSFQQGTCNDATYSLLPNGSVLVVNSQVIDQTLDTIEGTATLASNDGTGKLLVNFPSTNQTAEYWILDTDYDSYSLVYSCRNLENNQRRVWSWKLSKARSLTAAANNSMNAIIDTINVLDSRYYQQISQSDDSCFYYPEPSSNPVIFRGQCDENILLVSNFSAGDYLNTWYDIESYPTQFQFGTCPTATYTLNGNVVDVHNTEVVNQTLMSIYGTAVPYPDGSARLNVSFPIEGTNFSAYAQYYVLATDYTNFALVYSCANIDDDSRMVYSWKLSRNTSLSAAANTSINNVINNIPVLRQQYYNIRGHTEEDCFYYPDNNGGPVVLEGQCDPSNLVVSNFSLNSFAGIWYEVSRFPSELPSGECVANNYTALPNENSFNLVKSFVSSENLIVASGAAIVASDGSGTIRVTLTDNNGVGYDTTMYVVDVDYNDYALLYGCRDIGNNSKQIYSWKLSRNQGGLSSQAVTNINRVISETKDLSERYYKETGQSLSACFHYPEFDVMPEQITLLGPCDESIRGISNFNAAAYLGKWYEIASFPQPFQIGDCSRAYYSTDDGVVVNVMNTEVTNRTLNVAYATAVVASNDGTGVLNVTFTFPGFSSVSNYYVLATDYTDYALVYSCRNLDGGNERQVTSWKLSRNKTLSAQAESIMNTVINNTQGLLERYYVSTNQSDEACFYIPEVDRDQAPLFRGQCEDIEGVQGFNADRYIGWWHEIERYPTDADPGSCISSDFRASGNAYQIVETSVRNNNATVVTSNVAVSNNGRIRKTYSDGRIVDIWVLATDYESYSLLYSCENVNADYKRVWSAKHSKSRNLTQAAQNAISEVITRVKVLEPQFFLPVNQSDGVCFHYPELVGDQVVLPGQCYMNIPVVMQFDAAQYTGTWYQIQRYPQRFEKGNCTGARYSLNTETGEVTVLNWEVVDGELDTIEGNAFITSLDGSAKLIVNLPIRGRSDGEQEMVSMELYVLTTDYLSYSLAYSCVNIDPYRRAVGTWKLSRTRTMTAAGDVAINTYMASREEFNDAYFITVDQNDECPEPSSAILAKSSIIVLLISVIFTLLS